MFLTCIADLPIFLRFIWVIGFHVYLKFVFLCELEITIKTVQFRDWSMFPMILYMSLQISLIICFKLTFLAFVDPGAGNFIGFRGDITVVDHFVIFTDFNIFISFFIIHVQITVYFMCSSHVVSQLLLCQTFLPTYCAFGIHLVIYVFRYVSF
jgi:hypothetical protein